MFIHSLDSYWFSSIMGNYRGGAVGSWSFFITQDGFRAPRFEVVGVDGRHYVEANYIMPLDTWVQLAVTRKDGVVNIWVNGQSLGEGLLADTLVNNLPFRVGGNATVAPNTTLDTIDGYLDEVRVVNGNAIYTQVFKPLPESQTKTEN